VGLYCAGWIKRGPSGIIGTNIMDARETVASVLADVSLLSMKPLANISELHSRLASKAIHWDQYQRIDAQEAAMGAKVGKPREKITSITAMLDIARAQS
jgi:hypothetical protein